jgi:hypothetical protein
MGATQQMGGHRVNGPALAQEVSTPMHSKPIEYAAPFVQPRTLAVQGDGDDG